VLSSKVMLFERGDHGSFNSPAAYPELALATANTHDMAPLAGYWSGADLEIRERVGLTPPEERTEEERKRDVDRTQLLRRLADEHVIAEPVEPAPAALRGAVHAMLCRTPSALVALSLDDLAGESAPVNVPGVGPDRYPSWTRKMRDPIDVIFARPETEEAMRCDGRRGVVHG
jgi:4-alpha-glucanotransferase